VDDAFSMQRWFAPLVRSTRRVPRCGGWCKRLDHVWAASAS
jgi:hypothetical protein